MGPTGKSRFSLPRAWLNLAVVAGEENFLCAVELIGRHIRAPARAMPSVASGLITLARVMPDRNVPLAIGVTTSPFSATKNKLDVANSRRCRMDRTPHSVIEPACLGPRAARVVFDRGTRPLHPSVPSTGLHVSSATILRKNRRTAGVARQKRHGKTQLVGIKGPIATEHQGADVVGILGQSIKRLATTSVRISGTVLVHSGPTSGRFDDAL